MPKKIKLNGPVVGDSEAWIYDWFGIQTISPGAVGKALEEAGDEDVDILINSGGGAVFAGSEIYTMIKEHPGNVTVKITGLAASAASFIAMAGNKVVISPTGQIMIHNASTGAWGDKGVMEQGRSMLSTTDEAIANAYALKTGRGRDELLAMMDKETWLNAQDAHRLGFVDEIMFDEGSMAVTNSAVIGNVLPPEVIEKLRSELSKGLASAPVVQTAAMNISNSGSGGALPAADPPPVKNNKEGDNPMTYEELKEKHPELLNQITNAAITAERKRIVDLNNLAKAPGTAQFIQDAIEKGETVADVAVKVLMASAERLSQEGTNRQQDAANSGAAGVIPAQPINQADKDAAEEKEAVDNMVNYATELINKKGGRA